MKRRIARALALGTLAAVTVAMAACKPPENTSTPLPTKDKTITPVQQKLDQAEQAEAKRRAQIDVSGGDGK
jgi:hypothetical protein